MAMAPCDSCEHNNGLLNPKHLPSGYQRICRMEWVYFINKAVVIFRSHTGSDKSDPKGSTSRNINKPRPFEIMMPWSNSWKFTFKSTTVSLEECCKQSNKAQQIFPHLYKIPIPAIAGTQLQKQWWQPKAVYVVSSGWDNVSKPLHLKKPKLKPMTPKRANKNTDVRMKSS